MISKTGTPFRDRRRATRVIDAEQQLPQPGFVAQVVGQVLGTMPDSNAAARAYARSGHKNPLFAEMA